MDGQSPHRLDPVPRPAGTPPAGAADASGRARGLRRFLRARQGSTAVEFGLLALPFLALLCASLENGLVAWQQEILQQAVVDAGRQIYTGQFQTANQGVTNQATLMSNFKTALCTRSDGTPRTTIFPCANVRISVTQASSFSSAAPVSPTATNGSGNSDWNANFGSYTCAGASAIMIVQAAVDIPVFFTFLGSQTATLPNRRRVLQAATVFKVEPYTAGSVCS